jgi:hypothetical protein
MAIAFFMAGSSRKKNGVKDNAPEEIWQSSSRQTVLRGPKFPLDKKGAILHDAARQTPFFLNRETHE